MSRFLMPLACVILAVGALPYFEHRWVTDESWYSVPAVTLVRTGHLRNPALPPFDYESRVDTRPPLMPLSLAASFRMFGSNVVAARSGVLLASFLTLFVVYAIGRTLGDPVAGAIAAVLVAADNFVVLAARTARPEAWVMLFGSAALLLGLGRRSGRRAFAAGVCAGIAALFHAIGLAFVAAMALLLIAQERRAVVRSRRTYACLAGAMATILPFLVWLLISPERIEAAKQMYGRDATASVGSVVAKERLRYADFLGVPNQRLNFPIRVPLRLPVALAVGAIPPLIWFLRLPSPSARYLAIEAPVFALAMASAITSLTGTRWHRAALGWCAVCVVTQLAGTMVFLRQASQADYPVVAAALRSSIPPGHSCYGSLTLQFALADRECVSYQRTPFSYTAGVQRPEYMIVGDLDMMRGSGIGEDNFADLRRAAFAFVDHHGTLTARIQDSYYGDLRVYRITYAEPSNQSEAVR